MVEIGGDIKDLVLARTGVAIRQEGEAIWDLALDEAITLSTILARMS